MATKKELQILEEAANRMVAYLQENAPIFKGEEEEVRKVIMNLIEENPESPKK